MVPFADYYLGDYKTEETPDGFNPTSVPEEPNAVYIADGAFDAPRAINFRRTRKRLWALFNQRYFESSVVPVIGGPRWVPAKMEFLDGWYAEELDEKQRPYRWMAARSRTLLEPPEPLTRSERAMLIAGSVVAAASRVLARGHSMWDWDEALFCLGVRDYDVIQHQPHPPGYPLFIAAAKLVRLAVHSDFLAL